MITRKSAGRGGGFLPNSVVNFTRNSPEGAYWFSLVQDRDWVPNVAAFPKWRRIWDSNSSVRQTPAERSAAKAARKATWPLKRILSVEKKGPRLAYKVRSPSGKLVWARMPIHVYKWVRVPPSSSKKKKSRSGLDLAPNYLLFEKTDHINSGPVSVSFSVPGWCTDVHSGLLQYSFNVRTFNAGIEQGDEWADGRESQKTGSAIIALTDKVTSKFYEKVKNQKVNLGNLLAERAQTTKMVVEMVQRLAKGFVALKRGNIGRAVDALLPNDPKGVANDWLLYQYGIKPLASDLDGALQHLADPEPVVFDIISAKTEEVPTHVVAQYGEAGYFSRRTEITQSAKITVKLKSRCRAMPVTRNLSRLGLGNPAAVIWEIAPWSFIADWVIPIGDFLNNSDAFAGVTCDYSTKTTVVETTTTLTCVFGGNIGGYDTSSASCSWTTKKFKVTREILSSPPPLGLPSFKNPVSEGHVLNAIALITQLFKR